MNMTRSLIVLALLFLSGCQHAQVEMGVMQDPSEVPLIITAQENDAPTLIVTTPDEVQTFTVGTDRAGSGYMTSVGRVNNTALYMDDHALQIGGFSEGTVVFGHPKGMQFTMYCKDGLTTLTGDFEPSGIIMRDTVNNGRYRIKIVSGALVVEEVK